MGKKLTAIKTSVREGYNAIRYMSDPSILLLSGFIICIGCILVAIVGGTFILFRFENLMYGIIWLVVWGVLGVLILILFINASVDLDFRESGVACK